MTKKSKTMKPKMSKGRKMKAEFSSLSTFMKKVGKPSFKEEIVQEDNRFYLLPSQVKELKETISRSTFSAGIFLGEKKRGVFKPSLAFIELLAKESNEKPVILDKKTAWLFLCGRDVFGNSLKEKPKEGFVFVANTKKENLGLGFYDGQNVLNVIDRGDFLRREK